MVEMFELNGQNVYTQSNQSFVRTDIAAMKQTTGTITDAYFFKIGPDRTVERMDYDPSLIEENRSGLHVTVRNASGPSDVASLSIAGLDRIASFLDDMCADVESVAGLKGRPVTQYRDLMALYAIGVQK